MKPAGWGDKVATESGNIGDSEVDAVGKVDYSTLFLNSGVKYYLMPGEGRFYVAGMIGLYRMKVNTEGILDLDGSDLPGVEFNLSGSTTGVALSSGIGAEIDLSSKTTLDLLARYQWVQDNFSHLDFRLSVLFNL